MRQVFGGWGVATKRKGKPMANLTVNYPHPLLQMSNYISCVEGLGSNACLIVKVLFIV